MPIKRQEDVVQFQVPIDNPFRVEVLEGEQDLTSVEFGLSQCELFLLDVKHEISAGDVLHDEVDPCLRLET